MNSYTQQIQTTHSVREPEMKYHEIHNEKLLTESHLKVKNTVVAQIKSCQALTHLQTYQLHRNYNDSQKAQCKKMKYSILHCLLLINVV
jgi:hypothetical protein